jgi:hypothetical protein
MASIWLRFNNAFQRANRAFLQSNPHWGENMTFYYRVEASGDTIRKLRAESPGWPDSAKCLVEVDPSIPEDRIAFWLCGEEEWLSRWDEETRRRGQ